jgi:acetolactate synthase-1/2/3 large subunit
MNWSSRPVILLGHGARNADIGHLLTLGVPILTSWQAKDLIDNDHPLYFGSPGIYGQRRANKVLHESDYILAIGNRMAIWNVGYEAPKQRIEMVDVDGEEVLKFSHAVWICESAERFIPSLKPANVPDWLAQCTQWRYPLIEPHHKDDEYINSYLFTDALHEYLRPDEVIVTDMGTPLICAHQVLRLKPPQRILTSGGLGEMGCALPASIGASFARNKGEVLCLHADGGMMLNLQELQTIIHHKLPVKIIVYRNEGYLMIQHTQRVGNMPESGVNAESGVSFPDYRRLAQSMGMQACDVRTWMDFKMVMPEFFNSKEPALIQYWMKPRQPLYPKLDPIKNADGTVTSPRFCDMTP